MKEFFFVLALFGGVGADTPSAPEPITPSCEGRALRYADGRVDSTRNLFFCVREGTAGMRWTSSDRRRLFRILTCVPFFFHSTFYPFTCACVSIYLWICGYVHPYPNKGIAIHL